MAKQIVCDCHVQDVPASVQKPEPELSAFGKIVVAVLTVGALVVGVAVAASDSK